MYHRGEHSQADRHAARGVDGVWYGRTRADAAEGKREEMDGEEDEPEEEVCGREEGEYDEKGSSAGEGCGEVSQHA